MPPQESILARMRREQFESAAPEEQEETSILARMRKQAERKPEPLPEFTGILSTLGIAENMDDIHAITNRVKNIGEIVKVGAKTIMGVPLTTAEIKLAETVDAAYLATDDAEKQMWRDYGSTAKKLVTGQIGGGDVLKEVGELVTGIKSSMGWSNLPKLPVQIISAMLGDAAKATTGLNISKKEVEMLPPEEINAAMKATVGNAAAIAAVPAIEAAMAGVVRRTAVGGIASGTTTKVANPFVEGTTATVDAGMMKAPLGAVAKAGEKVVGPVGRIGESIIRDATTAAGSGAIQGALANGGDPAKAVAGFIQGLMFAPIGVATGWYRGVKGRTSIREDIITQAHDVAAIRLWQETQNANLEQIKGKFSTILNADDIRHIPIKSNADSPLDQWRQEAAKELNDTSLEFEPLDYVEEQLKKAGAKTGDFETWKAQNKFAPTNINELFDLFDQNYLKQDSNFYADLVKFAKAYEIEQFLPEITEKFVRRYYQKHAPTELAEIQALDNAIATQEKLLKAKGFVPEDIYDVATKHGWYVTNEFGALRIRDVESGIVTATADNQKDALAFMRNSGDPANVPDYDIHAAIPAPQARVTAPVVHPFQQLLEPEPLPRMEGFKIGDKYYPDIPRINPNEGAAALDLKFGILTGTNAFFEAVDKIYGTNFKRGFLRTQEAHRRTLVETKNNIESVKMRFADKYLRDNKFTTDDLELLGAAIESRSWEELTALGGHINGVKLSTTAQELAQFAHKQQVDLGRVLSYRRSLNALNAEAQLAARRRALDEYDRIRAAQDDPMAATEAAEVRDRIEAEWMDDPKYNHELLRLQEQYKPDADFMKANELFDAMGKSEHTLANTSGAVRLKLALENPDMYGLSRADFIAKHGLDTKKIKALEMFEQLYKEYGDKFGIGDARKINGYMNHYRLVGDLLDEVAFSDFERGIMDPTLRQFASAMVRSGEISNYSKNPWTNLQAYIRGGVKAKNLYPVLNEEFGAMNQHLDSMAKELGKLKNLNPKIAETAEYRINAYQRDITGQQSMSMKEWKAIQARLLSKMAKNENGQPLTEKEILDRMDRPEYVDTMLNLQSAAYLGGRPSLGFRDMLDVNIKFFAKYGGKRLGQLWNTKVSQRRINELIAAGDVVNPEGADIYNPTAVTNVNSKAYELSRMLSNAGYKGSLQQYFYVRNQAAVYEHTFSHTIDVLNKLAKTKRNTQGIFKDKQAAFKEIGLNNYSDYTKAQFETLVDSDHIGAAARLLAQEEVRDVVGYMTRGNQAPILNSTPGRMFGQMGSWAMTNRSVIQNIATRGTKDEIAKKLARYTLANTAIVLTGHALGLNLGRWLLLPTSLITTGGPMLGAIKAAGSAATAELGGDPAQTAFTRREFARAARGFVPFSSAGADIGKALDLVKHGSGYGVVRPAAQLFGVPVIKDRRNALDWALGNYPVSWHDPTPTNWNPFSPYFNPNPF